LTENRIAYQARQFPFHPWKGNNEMTVSLTKGGPSVELKKPDGTPLTQVFMGLGWDATKKRFSLSSGSIDLDASAILFDASRREVDSVWFSHLRSNDGSLVHTGDNLTGAGDGDDEVIKVDLTRVPSNVQTIVFVVNSYTGQTFERVENAFCRLVDSSGGRENEVARYDLTNAKGAYRAVIMAKVYRDGAGWKIQAVGTTVKNGRTYKELVGPARDCL
jgi:tellurium resistance protein TerZ